jgi:MYXO-CTERM domain-containing protein
MLSTLLCAAAIAMLPITGEVPDDGSDYHVIPFDVPEGTVEIEVAHASDVAENILDWGLWDPETFRGWGGGLRDNAVVGVSEASRGYVRGPVPAGTWKLVIGKAQIKTWPAGYTVEITLRDQETLTVRERAVFAPVVLATGRRWYSGDFHVHSHESGDATASFADIAALARERGIDVVALSDHNTVAQHDLMAAFQAGVSDVLFVRSAEVTTYGGHGNAFGFAEYIDHRVGYEGVSAETIVAAVKEQGGLFSINHPAFSLGDACIGCAWEHEDTPWSSVDAIEVHSGNYEVSIGIFTPRALELWDRMLDQGHRITAIGGSDDHRAGIDLNAFQSPIGSPTTMVFADELSEAGVLAAVRQGRVVVKLRGPGDPMVELTATGAGGVMGGIGDTVPGAAVTIEARVQGGQGMELVMVQNGQPAGRVAIDAPDWTHVFEYEISGAVPVERFRAHVVDEYDVTITNHVFVEHMALPGGEDAGGGCACNSAGPDAALFLGLLAVAFMRRRRVVGQTARRAPRRT